MSTIDHKAKALDHLSGWDTDGDWEAEVAAAQVHATLYAAEQTAALVEQQRIANLIALEDQRWQRTNERGNYWGADVLRGRSATPEGTAELYPQIQKALGLS